MLALFDQGLMKSQSPPFLSELNIWATVSSSGLKPTADYLPFPCSPSVLPFPGASSLPCSEDGLGGPSWYGGPECGSGSVLVLALSRWDTGSSPLELGHFCAAK